jgi:hypothetical protein
LNKRARSRRGTRHDVEPRRQRRAAVITAFEKMQLNADLRLVYN